MIFYNFFSQKYLLTNNKYLPSKLEHELLKLQSDGVLCWRMIGRSSLKDASLVSLLWNEQF
jgi:hypothetical protein